MKNLLTRSLTGFIFVVIILGSLLLGKITYAVVFCSVLFGALVEFYSFFKDGKCRPAKIYGYILGLLIFAILFSVASGILSSNWIFLFFPFLLFIYIIELYKNRPTPIENMAVTTFAILYIAVPVALINFLVFPAFDDNRPFVPDLFIAVLAIIWVYDSAAYLFGVSFGKHRLFERISPKKSWEGAIGGTIAAVGAAYLVAVLIPEISLVNWMVLSVLIVIASTFGDLTESLIKRSVGIKDSSNLFPGHGGVLDRFDSLLFAVPVVVLYLKLIIE